jgi:hypothetical protein
MKLRSSSVRRKLNFDLDLNCPGAPRKPVAAPRVFNLVPLKLNFDPECPGAPRKPVAASRVVNLAPCELNFANKVVKLFECNE